MSAFRHLVSFVKETADFWFFILAAIVTATLTLLFLRFDLFVGR